MTSKNSELDLERINTAWVFTLRRASYRKRRSLIGVIESTSQSLFCMIRLDESPEESVLIEEKISLIEETAKLLRDLPDPKSIPTESIVNSLLLSLKGEIGRHYKSEEYFRSYRSGTPEEAMKSNRDLKWALQVGEDAGILTWEDCHPKYVRICLCAKWFGQGSDSESYS